MAKNKLEKKLKVEEISHLWVYRKLNEAIELLKTQRTNSEMALSGDWDKNDEGFQESIKQIDKFLDSE